MQNYIGGLFKREEDAGTAIQALLRAGFAEESITLLTRKPQAAPVHKDRVQAPAVGRSALVGAVILGTVGALLGLAAGLGIFPIPGVDAAAFRLSTSFVLSSALAGLVIGGATGAILWTAFRLLRSHDKVQITSKGVKRGGLLVVARVDEDQAADSARRALQASGAVDLQNLTDKWDLNVWSEFNRLPRSSVPQDSRNA